MFTQDEALLCSSLLKWDSSVSVMSITPRARHRTSGNLRLARLRSPSDEGRGAHNDGDTVQKGSGDYGNRIASRGSRSCFCTKDRET